jgi:Glycosyl hydrolases family 16
MTRVGVVLAATVLFCSIVVAVGTGGTAIRSAGAAVNCEAAGASSTEFPAAGRWEVVNEQTFNVSSLPAAWDAFSGWFDGINGQARHSFREPSLLAFPGGWMRYENVVLATAANGGYDTIGDAGADETYAETYDPTTTSWQQGYDVASHEWGFQWCARFNGGGGFDTAFAFVPTDGAWPPEIDFIEHGPRAGNSVTLHIHWKATRYNDGHPCDPDYPATNSENCHANFPSVSLVVGHWNSYAVTWSAREIDVWIDGRRASSLTVTPRICTQRADQPDGYGDTGVEGLCLPNGYVGNATSSPLEPYVWDMQVNSYNGVTHYSSDQTDLAWFESLRP